MRRSHLDYELDGGGGVGPADGCPPDQDTGFWLLPPVRHRPPDQPYAVLDAGHRAAGRRLYGPGADRHRGVPVPQHGGARYDADRTVAAFAARLKDEVDLNSIRVDLNSIRDDLAGAVHQALEPAHVSV